MMDKRSILFVCLGNICRSPACEGICRTVCGGRIIVDSASTSVVHVNESPDERAVAVCSRHGIDIREHRARQMTAYDWLRFDVIAVLDPNVLNNIICSKPDEHKARVILFNAPDGIADPYYGGRLGFQRMFEQISSKMKSFLVESGILTEKDFLSSENS
jgi:protein-tyrosine phosphatase